MNKLLTLVILSVLSTAPTAFAETLKVSVCGLEGSLDERIADCSSQQGELALVSRNSDSKEIYKDLSTGLLWSQRFLKPMIYRDALKACADKSQPELSALSDLFWTLPSISEYRKIDAHNPCYNLPHMNGFRYWSSTLVPVSAYPAYLFLNYYSCAGGDNGFIAGLHENTTLAQVWAQCVAKP